MQMLYCDDDLCAVAKPAGMLMHRSRVAADVAGFAVQAARDLAGRHVYPVHRLDRPTAGVLLFAFSPPVADRLMRQFAAAGVAKAYIAVVRGWMQAQGLIDYPLGAVADPLAAVPHTPKPARTAYQCLATVELDVAVGRYASARYSLLRLSPQTGRRHQLRRHLKHVFHPIIGDTTYGDGQHNRLFRERFDCRRLLLAARELAFTHPVSGAAMRLQAPLDTGFAQVLAALGWDGIGA